LANFCPFSCEASLTVLSIRLSQLLGKKNKICHKRENPIVIQANMKYIYYSIILIILVALAQLFALEMPILGAAPNFWFLFALFSAATGEGPAAVFVGFIGGLFGDLLSSAPIGSYTIGALLAISIVYALFQRMTTLRFDWKDVAAVGLLGIFFLLIWLQLYNVLLSALRLSLFEFSFQQFFRDSGSILLATALLMYPTYWLSTGFWRLMRRLEMKKKGAN
jgi:rod shape-determining protein MreD